jgi:hypothetical protein
MSATLNVSPSAPNDQVKKERAPRLPAKFAKFIQFGFYFVNSYNQQCVNDGSTPLDSDALYLALQVFSSVDEQKSFVQGFFDNNKDVNKQLRDVVKQFVKSNKSPVARKPRAKKVSMPSESNPTDTVPSDTMPADTKPAVKGKRGRKPAVLVNGNPDIVAEIVALAQNSDPIPPAADMVPSKEQEKEAKKLQKDQEKAAAKLQKDQEKAAAKLQKEQEKAAAKLQKELDKKAKTKTAVTPTLPDSPANPTTNPTNPTNPTNDDDDDDDDEPLQVSILSLNGTQYLIDDQQTVYDFSSQEPIGTFNPNTQSISLI